ncbi:MAG: vanomycin resistance protein VanB [Firmicutes bacterium]|nr:vanomycin resistance protein VanB [Bacillota bacterium]
MTLKSLTPLIAFLLTIFIVIYLFGGFEKVWATSDILPGIIINETNIGGQSKQKAEEKLVAMEKKIINTPVIITNGDQSWSLSLNKVGLKVDIGETLRRAMSIGRQGSFVDQLKTRHQIKKNGYILQPIITVDQESLSTEVKRLAKHLNIPAKNASFSIGEDDSVTITPSQNGQRIDIERLKLVLEQELLVRDNVELTIPVKKVKPEFTTQDIKEMGVSGLLSRFTTKFNPDLVNRSYNIRVAANALDGLLVVPGEEVSFNEVVGPRSSEAGYKEAGVIVNNEMVDGLGGGVCQVSTTLYNAVLLANLEVVDRKNHSLPISYVPIGRDATVVYGIVDLKFINNTGRCIYIKTKVKDAQVTIKIYGDVSKKKTVAINSWVEEVLPQEVQYEEDNNLKRGQRIIKQEGSKGYIAHAERLVIKNGEVLKREELPISKYNPVEKVIAIGIAEPETAITPSSDLESTKK